MHVGFGKVIVQRLLRRLRRSPPPKAFVADPTLQGWPTTLPIIKREGSFVELCVELPERYTAQHQVNVYPSCVSIEVYGQNRSMRRILPLEKGLQRIEPKVTRQGLMLVLRFDLNTHKPQTSSRAENSPQVTSLPFRESS